MQEYLLAEDYLHGIDLKDWYPCWNLALSGCLHSPDYVAQIDKSISSLHKPIRDIPINELEKSNQTKGMCTPRGYWSISVAASIRKGEKLGIGLHHTKWLTQQDEEYILRMSEIELEFENVRRTIRPKAASRLASLYIAENNQVGKRHIHNMLNFENLFIFPVLIQDYLRVTRADTGWFDIYCKDKNEKHIINYWSSIPYHKINPTWEILIEGVIKIKNQKDQIYIQEHGAHRSLMP